MLRHIAINYSKMMHYTGTYTDHYQLSMAQAYFLQGKQEDTAVFDYFFRKLPFNGGYAIFAGLADILPILENLGFDAAEIEYLGQQGFDPLFLDYLRNFRFKGNVYACSEGELVFPLCPMLSVEANIIEAQLIETLLLNLLNFQTLIATKASRMRAVAGESQLIEFGLRRAQGPGGYYASRAAIIGGFNATSNVCAGRDYQIRTAGTMAHSFVQSYEDELSAFRSFALIWPEHCVLLVDTYDTLKSGLPNAIKVAKEMEARGQQLQGIRLDSGDLAYLSKAARNLLDQAGLKYVKITASNQLDEYVIRSLKEQQASIDVFGVGTHLVTGAPDCALDGVYKLAAVNNTPRIKLSETFSKTTFPAKKQVYRVLDNYGSFLGLDVIALMHEQDLKHIHHPFDPLKSCTIKEYQKEPLLHKVMAAGKSLLEVKNLEEISRYRQERLALLPEEYKRFENPHLYKVSLSTKLKEARDHLIQHYKSSNET